MRSSKFVPSYNITILEGEEAPPADAPAAGAPPAADPPEADTPPAGDPRFTQADVDRMIKHRLRKADEEQKRVIGEMQALKARADLTREERTDFEKRLQQLNDTLLTTEELAAKERKRQEEQYTHQIQERDAEINRWQSLYTESTIQRSITDAAIQHKSFYPEQIVSILDRGTRLVEELVDGNPTGKLKPMVRFDDFDKEGKPVTLDLSPVEAVKRMTEMTKYQNLFEGKGTGGVGSRNHPDGTKQDLAAQAKNIDSYIKGRREGSINL
jgi:hypothetical protein